MEKPQIISHIQKSLNYTLFDSRWIPCSAKFVVLGNYARGTGAMQIYECSKGEVNLLHEVSDDTFFVCFTHRITKYSAIILYSHIIYY